MAEFACQNFETCDSLVTLVTMKYIVLDRDGVINVDSDDYIKSPDEFVPIPGSLEAMARLNRAGVKIIVATNQSGIARHYYTEVTLAKIHEKLNTLLAKQGGALEEIFYCPHGPDDECDCRKPKPGMLNQIISKYAIVATELLVVGDSIRDLQSAHAVGARPVLVETGNGLKTKLKLKGLAEFSAIPVYKDLSTVVDAIIDNQLPC